MSEPKQIDLKLKPRRARLDWPALGVVAALLMFFGAMWIHMNGRIDAVQTTLIGISETLGRLDERTKHQTEAFTRLESRLDRQSK